jgi:hypothetical protein
MQIYTHGQTRYQNHKTGYENLIVDRRRGDIIIPSFLKMGEREKDN